MRIADAVLDARTIPVPFSGGNVLTITYKQSNATAADLSRMQKEQDEAAEASKKAGKGRSAVDNAALERLITSMLDMIVEWDLTGPERDEDHNEIPDTDRPVPLTHDGLYYEVTMPIYQQIMRAVVKDQREMGEADGTSDDG